MKYRAPFAIALSIFVPACGSGIGSGTGPSAMPTPNVVFRSVSFTAFLDENGNKVLDSNELTRIPNAEIVAGGVKGRTAELTGQAIIQVPEGMQTLDVTANSLPPYYRPPATMTIAIPTSGPIMVPISLPLGSAMQPNVYMGFGDSITNGEADVGDGQGYRGYLQTMLRAHFGTGTVVNEGIDATRSDDGAARISASLSKVKPAFTLIFYGVNDWNDSRCGYDDLPCFTTDSIRSMVQQINRAGGHAFIGTITPVNVGYDDRAPALRNDWVAKQNIYIKQVADQEGAVVVDLEKAFLNSGIPNSSLFVDHIHPQEVGYQIMAKTWFAAIANAYTKLLSEF